MIHKIKKIEKFTKVLCIGDPHFKNSCTDESRELHKQTIKTIKNNNYDATIILGDVLDRHALIDMVPFCMALNYVKDIAELCKVYVLVGNHDISHNKINIANEKEKNHSLQAFKYIDNVVIVDEPHYIDIMGLNCCLLPYYPVGEFPNIECDILFCHQEFKGCKMNGIKSKHGDTIDENMLVISGHIHDFQVIKKNIVYPGTPFMVSFGESSDKGFVEIVEYDGVNDFIRYKDIKLNRIPVNIIPKVTIKCNAKEFRDVVGEADKLKDNKVKIIISDTESNISTLNTECKHIVVIKIIRDDGVNNGVKIEKNFERKTFNDFCMELLNEEEKSLLNYLI